MGISHHGGFHRRVRESLTEPTPFVHELTLVGDAMIRYFARAEVSHSDVATFRQNVGELVCVPALWRGAATIHSRPRS